MRRALLLLALAAGRASAGVYEHVDPASGMTIMNNLPPAAGAATAARQVAFTAPAAAGQAFPRVSSMQQNQRDSARRDILASELQTEEQALAAAAARRAAADVLARHAANVAALKRELAGVR
jgi:hypothetical protein